MVTGASSGIGRELSLNLAKAGIITSARRVDKPKSLCDHINSNSEGPVQCEGPARCAIAVELDVTANGSVRSSLELSEEEWEHTFTTNLKGAWLVSKYVCRRMHDAKQGRGSVINNSSITGLNRVLVPGGLAYASSKIALDKLTETMTLELGVDKIRVNSIAPGVFKSEMTESLIQQKWFHGVISRTTPLRSIGATDPVLTSLVRRADFLVTLKQQQRRIHDRFKFDGLNQRRNGNDKYVEALKSEDNSAEEMATYA
ncbi:hypothetical protein RND71_015216 [Anisodus tanguticus]|uniref:Uncharacterized protein n=1 Tax=Anisodus tanguticus TaxID=243964 RepID=A0AAE1S6Z5_9SOLA|nr:hypothetical protein RND71_015216 [Anisodus tanguticus]